jgi:hypothetical protein
MKGLAVMLAVAALCPALLQTGAAAAGGFQKLSGRQIQARLAGMQLTDEVHWRDVYDRNGTLRSYSNGMEKVGKWAVEKNELCVYFKEPDDGCYEVSLSGDRIEMKPTGLGLSIEGILQTPTDRK